MKKIHKKLLTCALAAMLIGAGVGGVSALTANVEVVDAVAETEVATETVVNGTLSTRNITWADGASWFAHGTINGDGIIPAQGAQIYYAAKSAENIKLVRNGKTYTVGTVGANSLQVDGYNQFYIKPEFLTFPADFEGEQKVKEGDQIILEGDFVGLSEGFTDKVARFEKTTMTNIKAPSKTHPNGKIYCLVEVGEYKHYDMVNVRESSDCLNDGFYFLADTNGAYAETGWTQNYKGLPNTLSYIRDGVRYYTDREFHVCKIKRADGSEYYYLQGWSAGNLGQELKDGDELIFDGIFYNAQGYKEAIVFDDVHFILHLADRADTTALDWKVTLVNPNVTFVNDGTVVSNTGTLPIGTKVEKPATDPVKAEDDDFTYKFIGWYNGAEAFDFSEAPVGQITLTAKYEMVAKNAVEGGYGLSVVSSHASRDVYFFLPENDITVLPSWNTRLQPVTADSVVLIRDGNTILSNCATTALCKIDANKYHISGWQFAGLSNGFEDGDVIVVNGYFRAYNYETSEYMGEMLHIAETWLQYTVDAEGKVSFNVLNPGVKFADNSGKVLKSVVGAYGESFVLKAEDIPEVTKEATAEYTYSLLGWWLGNDQFDLTTEITSSIELRPAFSQTPVEYTAVINNADGTQTTVNFNCEDVQEKLQLLLNYLPEATAEYTYSWAEPLPTEVVLKDYEFTVVKTPVEYTLTIILNPMDRMTMPEQRTVAYGAELNLTAPEEVEGKTFLKWIVIDIETGAESDAPTTMPARNLTVYAKWQLAVYTVTITMPDETTETLKFAVEGDPNDMDVVELAALGFVLEMFMPEATAEYTYAWAEALPETFELQNYELSIVATPVEVVPPETSEEPETSEAPEASEEPETSEAPATSEAPETSEKPATSEGEKKSGCAGGISTITFGVIALGLGVMKLFKKKED